MPGGKGNIKPIDGKQFSKDYQPQEIIWTEEKSIELMEELIQWLKEDGNVFCDDFMYLHKGFKYNILHYISSKFTSVSTLYATALHIQKTKLIKDGVNNKTNAQMTKFVLNVNHGMTEKTEVENNTNIKGSIDISKWIDEN